MEQGVGMPVCQNGSQISVCDCIMSSSALFSNFGGSEWDGLEDVLHWGMLARKTYGGGRRLVHPSLWVSHMVRHVRDETNGSRGAQVTDCSAGQGAQYAIQCPQTWWDVISSWPYQSSPFLPDFSSPSHPTDLLPAPLDLSFRSLVSDSSCGQPFLLQVGCSSSVALYFLIPLD